MIDSKPVQPTMHHKQWLQLVQTQDSGCSKLSATGGQPSAFTCTAVDEGLPRAVKREPIANSLTSAGMGYAADWDQCRNRLGGEFNDASIREAPWEG